MNGKSSKKTWRVDLNFREIAIGLEDDPMLQTFTNQDEIVEIFAQRQIFCCRDPRMKLNLLKRLKKSKIYRKYCDIHLTNVSVKHELPQKFIDP